jgi:hypothetical protein
MPCSSASTPSIRHPRVGGGLGSEAQTPAPGHNETGFPPRPSPGHAFERGNDEVLW